MSDFLFAPSLRGIPTVSSIRKPIEISFNNKMQSCLIVFKVVAS